MMKTLIALFLLIALPMFGAVPAYTSFKGTSGIIITTNPPTGDVLISGAGVFTSSGTNATIAVSTNGVLVIVAATNINFVTGSNVFLTATNISSRAHIGINAFTPVPFIEGAVTNLLLTWILPVLTVDTLTVSNLLASPPLSSVQYNSNGITRGSAGFIYTNGQVRVADIVVAGQGVEITTGSLVFNGGATALAAWNDLGNIRWPSSGVVRFEDQFSLNMNRIQLGGDTAAFPAIGRTNGDVIILGANGNFKLGGSTNRLIAPAVHIANDGAPGTTLLSLDNPLSSIRWDMAIDAHPETYFLSLGRVGDGTPTMVWELGGNVGIGITNPTVRLDVQGRFMARSNVYFPNISSNALPVAFLAVDSDGQVYETAVPAGGGAATPAPPISSVQFNSNGVMQGSAGFVFTNGQVGIGTASPGAELQMGADTGTLTTDLFLSAGANGDGAANLKLGTKIREWQLTAMAFPYTLKLDYVGTDAPLSNIITALVGGNVGISTVSPTNTLDVNGHTSLRSNLFLANLPTNGSPVAFLATDAAGVVYETAVPTGGGGGGAGSFAVNPNQFVTNSQLNFKDGALTTNLNIKATSGSAIALTVDTNVFVVNAGNVGLGSASPITRLHVEGNGNNLAGGGAHYNTYITQPGANNGVFFGYDTNGVIGVVGATGSSASSLAFWTFTGAAWSEKMRINGSGNVGIGTIAPSSKLTVSNAVGSAGTPLFHVGTNNTGNGFLVSSNGNVSIGSRVPSASLDVTGQVRAASLIVSNVTASRMAAFHTDKTLTNGATTVALLDNFFAMGITNIISPDANIVIRTNAGVLTISNSVAGAGAFAAGNSNQIPFLNPAGTGYMYAGYLSVTNPGFGFSPSGPNGGYGGLMVFGNSPMGLVTIGHPNAGSDFATFATALVVSNRYNGAADFKNDMVKIDAVMIGGGLRSDSTMTRWRVWQGTTSSNDVAELTIGGVLTLAGGLPTNNAAFTVTTNNFALDTYYTNVAQRAYVTCTIGMTNILSTDRSQVALYLDQNADGTWERTGLTVRIQGVALMASAEQLGAFIQPGGRFIFTNLTTGTAASSIENNSSQWTKQ